MLSRLFKKLDLLIVKAFIGPFIATFFITLFVLVLQFFWLYIDDVVGKGIDVMTVLQLIMYLSATLVPLALPLAVLLSSIMTLGNLGETFELVAIKSAGISLLRFMRPLFFVSVLLTLIAFYFNNNILPLANLKMSTIKYDIIVKKPAFDIKEGVFYDKIEGFVIKIGKKEQDDSTIRNVVIYEQNSSNQQDNMIVANSGTMVVSPDKQSLVFTLHDGWRYEEHHDRTVTTGSSLVRIGFTRYKKILDLSSFKMNRTSDSAFRNNHQMKKLPELQHAIDSIKKKNSESIAASARTLKNELTFTKYLDTTGWDQIERSPGTPSKFLLSETYARDSINKTWQKDRRRADSLDKAQDSLNKARKKTQDSVHAAAVAAAKKAGKPAPAEPKPLGDAPLPGLPHQSTVSKEPPPLTFTSLLPDSVRRLVVDKALGVATTAKVNIEQPLLFINGDRHNLVEYEIDWHEKISMAVAVLVMFLIGAPLGSIIRKGGIGMPLVFAVIFFVVFFLLNNFGKKLTSQEVMTPLGGIWLSTYVLTPIGLFLTYKAMNDSQLFNKEFYHRITRNIRSLVRRLRKPKASAPAEA